jgi:hypothetical protein
MTKKQIAYKGFNINSNNQLYCRDMIFEVGKTYTLKGDPIMCQQGYHYCRNLNDIDQHYNLRSSVICEVEILGKTVHDTDGRKSCTNKIKIIKMLTKEQVWSISNTGQNNTGFMNSGDMNSGDMNSGNRNSGDMNSGYMNSGNRNSGDMNSGDMNSGYMNSGNRNSGDMNSGDMNSGYMNSGYMNSGNRNSGYMNTKENKSFIFDVLSDMTPSDFLNSKYWEAITYANFPLTEWINYTDEEKQQDKAKELIEGYLKRNDYKETCARWWANTPAAQKKIILSIPNFDAAKFEEITGIKI